MDHHPVHLHSMLVHAVIALAPLAGAWRLLLWFSLVGMLVVALPATVTGITERNHMYANWPPSHRAKLALSIVLVLMTAGELTALAASPRSVQVVSVLGFATVVGNCAVALALSYFGLRITLGRQGFGSTSYIPDMDREPPLDILEVVAEQAHEPAKLIDVRQEVVA